MDFIDQIQTLSHQVSKQIDFIKTEEATKNAFVMPFINALGYNVFDPTEVVPEYTADVGLKKGEKVDYAILKDGKPIILFECKWSGMNLDDTHASQLYRYFSVTEARVGVLTNGIIYRFFSDIEEPNKMDEKFFFEVNLLEVTEAHIEELKKLTKSAFNLNTIISAASDLKYTKEIKRILEEQLHKPSEEFIRLFVSQIYGGKKTQTVLEQFSNIVKRAFNQFIKEKLNERLKSALAQENSIPIDEDSETIKSEEVSENNSKVVTTEEEIEGYHIVRAILSETIESSRVVYRDTVKYMGILLDDNNRKPICRLYFNSKLKKYIAFMDGDKKDEKVQIGNLSDIYKYGDRLKGAVSHYDEES